MFSKEDMAQAISYFLNNEFLAEPVVVTKIKQLQFPMDYGDRFEMGFGGTGREKSVPALPEPLVDRDS